MTVQTLQKCQGHKKQSLGSCLWLEKIKEACQIQYQTKGISGTIKRICGSVNGIV